MALGAARPKLLWRASRRSRTALERWRSACAEKGGLLQGIASGRGGGVGCGRPEGTERDGAKRGHAAHLPLTSRRRDKVEESALRDPSLPPPRSLANSANTPRPAPAADSPAGTWPRHALAPSGRGGWSPRETLAARTAASSRNTLRPKADLSCNRPRLTCGSRPAALRGAGPAMDPRSGRFFVTDRAKGIPGAFHARVRRQKWRLSTL